MTDRTLRTSQDLDTLDFAKHTGLVPVVAQDAADGRVLMVAWATREAMEKSLTTRKMHFWSRSRGALWQKGETSGSVLRVVSLHADCDGDTVLARVAPTGPACHTGEETCFGEGAEPTDGTYDPPDATLAALDVTMAIRQERRPEGSYTVRLLDDENLRLKKLGEETVEFVTALAKNNGERIPEEAADVLFHVLAALRGAGVPLSEVMAALEARRR
jgi:phosphoribosyl-ATP pyrophosphohydrolase/phosphoribosyl-AMP cyclohydrolase